MILAFWWKKVLIRTFQSLILTFLNGCHILRIRVIFFDFNLLKLRPMKMISAIVEVEGTDNSVSSNFIHFETKANRSHKTFSQAICHHEFMWSFLCICMAFLGFLSASWVGHMKVVGETFPFCFYDTWFYLVYYIAIILSGILFVPMSGFQNTYHRSSFWKVWRRLFSSKIYLELRAMVFFILHLKRIVEEIEYDEGQHSS